MPETLQDSKYSIRKRILVGFVLAGAAYGVTAPIRAMNSCDAIERIGAGDIELAAEALECSLEQNDHSGAEGHVSAIDDDDLRARVELALDKAQASEATELASEGGDPETVRYIIGLVENPEIKQWTNEFVDRVEAGETTGLFSPERQKLVDTADDEYRALLDQLSASDG